MAAFPEPLPPLPTPPPRRRVIRWRLLAVVAATVVVVVAGGSYLALREPSTEEKVDAKFDVVGIHRVPSLDVRWARFSESDWFGEFSGTVVAEVDASELRKFFDRAHGDSRWLRLAVPPEDASLMVLNGTTMQRLADRCGLVITMSVT